MKKSINVKEMFEEIGYYDNLLYMLLHSEEHAIEKLENGCLDIRINDIKTLTNLEGLIPQMYRLEKMFLPKIAFMDGLLSTKGITTPELLLDLFGENSFVTVATIKFNEHLISNQFKKIFSNGNRRLPLEFVIGYAQGNKEVVRQLLDLGVKNYIGSVIVDHNFRCVKGVGSKMVDPIISKIDRDGKSYLTTWADTGSSSINYSHRPGIGFWIKKGYNLLSVEESQRYINGLKHKHEKSGIYGRNYELGRMSVRDFERCIGDNVFTLKTNGDERMNKEELAVIKSHYEKSVGYDRGWNGVLMIRDPAKLNN